MDVGSCLKTAAAFKCKPQQAQVNPYSKSLVSVSVYHLEVFIEAKDLKKIC